MVSFNAEWLVSSLDTISTTISKEWIALIMLPAISSIAGTPRDSPALLLLVTFENSADGMMFVDG